MELLERQMVGAGLTVPARGPKAKWYMKWVTTGVCTLENDRPTQKVLGPSPRFHINRGINAWHRCPRPDAGPPTNPPANTIDVYITVSTQRCTWAAVGVTGGDGLHNARATVAFEAVAPSHAPNQCGEATALLNTLKILDSPQYASRPVTIHTSPDLSQRIAGVSHSQKLFREIKTAWSSSKTQRNNQLWLSAPRHYPGRHDWKDRAEALASHCKPPEVWGSAATLFPQAPIAAPPTADSCAICLEDFPDPFPTPAPSSRCQNMFTCSHSVCRTCDSHIQHSANAKCPLCRADRLHWNTPGQ